MSMKRILGYDEGTFTLPIQWVLAARRIVLTRYGALPWVGPKTIEAILRRKYGERVVTARKVRNFIQVHRDMAARAVEVRSVPYHLNLDLLNACNLRCRFCPTGTGQMDRERTRLPIETAKGVIDAVKDWMLTINPFQWGEPLLSPDIFEVIRYAHDAGTCTEIHSNLSVKVRDLGPQLVESRLDRLLVAVDGIEQSVGATYRRRVDTALVFENVRAIAEARRRAGSATPRIDMAFLVFRHNEHELPLLRAQAEALGADSFTARKAAIYHEDWVPESPAFQPLQEIHFGTCAFLYADLNVQPDGHVTPCCLNHSKKWDVGRVEELNDLQAFWNNAHHRAMRAWHADRERGAADDAMAPMCASCEFVARPGHAPRGRLSPMLPSLHAEGRVYDHGIGAGPTARG